MLTFHIGRRGSLNGNIKIKQYVIKYSLILLFFLSIVLSGCLNNNMNTEADPTKVATTEIVVVETKSVQSPTLALTPTRQETIIPTFTNTVSETPTPTPTITATWVPPTLNDYSIQTLIDTNGNCELPCWWGLVPGKTTKEQVVSFFDQIDINKMESLGQVERNNPDGVEVLMEEIVITYNLPGGNGIGNLILVFWDNVLVYIAVDEDTAIYRYQLESTLNKLGKPDEVFLYTVIGPGKANPYILLLIYKNKNTIFSFGSEAYKGEENIRICIEHDGPVLIMWEDEFGVLERLNDIFYGPDPGTEYPSIENVTNISVDGFYEQFTDPYGSDCFETSIEFW
jgi:hypothetical protein